MEIYTRPYVETMWENDNKIERKKGVHITNFSVLENVNLQVGDAVIVNHYERTAWEIVEIVEKRPSTIKGRDYYVTNSKFINY